MTEAIDTSLPTRKLMIMYIARVAKQGGILPEKAEMGFGTWIKLAEDFTPAELPTVKPWEKPYLDIAGVPFFADPDMEEGVVVFDHHKEEKGRGRFDGLQFLEI